MADEQAPTPEEMMRLIEEQSAIAAKHLRGEPLLYYVPWGLAWLLGFGALFLHYGLDGVPDGPVSLGQALAVLFAVQILAGAVTGFGMAKVSKGVRGESAAKGMMYGYTWFAGVALMWVICMHFTFKLPEAEASLLWASGFLMVPALLYMAGGAIWTSWPMFFMGVWIAAVDGVGVLLGIGWHTLLAAVLLGGGQVAFGFWLRRRM
ncbi:hypothetical protein [Nonomuraea turcica]|uniref:hypothetical protein n=1 Tax=Nonomuraea sp. G32 TaxID=3067274 RepID=UPI00273B21AB|nr:hypothetical protein [Nonomuraea sp. G32]MDP4504333.1 hypothetical protein [Nonomuraea sp. G32]